MSQIDIKTDLSDPTLDDGDHERMAHIVDQRLGTVAESIVNGTPVFALCGKVWRASRDPKKYPLCKTCIEIAKSHGMNVPNA
jgi:membrane protein implicated in regulation of membrane protease activity